MMRNDGHILESLDLKWSHEDGIVYQGNINCCDLKHSHGCPMDSGDLNQSHETPMGRVT